MHIEFFMNREPVSINKAYKNVQGRGRIKTGEYKRFETDFLEYLDDEVIRLKRDYFVDNFLLNEREYYLYTKLEIYTPESLFMLRQGGISNRKGDISNYRKVIQDVAFKYLEIDDKYSIHEENKHYFVSDSKGWSFKYTIELKKLNNYETI